MEQVLVTGGTGFVGSHLVAELIARGHRVRLLVRSSGRIAPALAPFGLSPADVEHTTGDVTDVAAVGRAVQGCTAVVHAAGVFSFDSRARAAIARTNVAGTTTVLKAGVGRGCDPIVYVSSTLALVRRDTTVTADSPPATLRTPYVRSQAVAEVIARRLQDAGAPVTIVYPGGVLGPDDPYLSDQNRRVRDILRGHHPVWPAGGRHITDVRDVVRVVGELMTPGSPGRRYLVPGQAVESGVLRRTLRGVTGRRLPAVPAPAGALLPLALLSSTLQRFAPVRLPIDYEAVLTTNLGTRYDDSATRRDLGIEPRPLAGTLHDTVAWLRHTGRLTARQAGRAA